MGNKIILCSSKGCVNYGLTVGEDDFKDLSVEDKKEVAIKVIDFLVQKDEWGLIQSLIMDAADFYGETTASGFCSTCNDVWEENTLEI